MVNAVGSMVEMREMTFGIFRKGAGKLSGNEWIGFIMLRGIKACSA